MAKTPSKPKTKTKTKTIRAEVEPEFYKAFEIIRINCGETKQVFLPRVLKFAFEKLGYLVTTLAAPIPPKVENPERKAVKLVRIHINTRQLARFKKLRELVPGCELDLDKYTCKRDLLYPEDREEEVLRFLANCPTGGKKKSGGGHSESGRPTEYDTRKKRAIRESEAILADEPLPMSITDLKSELKARGCDCFSPEDFNHNETLRKYIKESPRFEFEPDTDSVTLVEQEVVEPPQVDENQPIEEVFLAFERELAAIDNESPTVEPPHVDEEPTDESKVVASFFPRWAKV